MKKIRVLIVDDSALIRKMLTSSLEQMDDIEVIGTAIDAYMARDKIKQYKPDVITLDVEMPKMDGITFLANLMRLHPMPVVMVSTLTANGSDATLNALELGAVDYIQKPNATLKGNLDSFTEELHEKIVTASQANIQQLETYLRGRFQTRGKYVLEKGEKCSYRHLVAIGASTGGTEAIKEILLDLPGRTPPIIISQHIPPGYSASFAKRLDNTCEIHVVEARHDQPINPSTAYIAPGGYHLRLKTVRGHYICQLGKDDKVNRHRPSVEVMFDSVTEQANIDATGILLTGMGADGANAMLRMQQAGCYTIAQDEKSSLIWGMPGSAVAINAADDILPLHSIAAKIMKKPSHGKANAHFKIS
ncbi:MAG: chemotaxis response regulator protein-glutamate methylesterase [Pseudomonadales bacterium]|nr:chemotaxis response regulator protein-glutamate methylesterase [Pseudomonadales bacterium]